MKKYYQTAVASLLLSLCLASCNDNNKRDYPSNYVGFEHPTQKYRYDKVNQEETLEVKIIAVNKDKQDRIVKLSGKSIELPGEPSCFKLTETQVTIKADKKSATTKIKIFPKHVIRSSYLHLTCTPQWKDEEAKQSQLSIQFILK